MAARVLHFGTNDCNRVLVLRDFGYLVDDCPSINDVRSTLLQGICPEALLFSEGYPAARREAVTLARSSCANAPLILFENLNCDDETNFDLVIPPLTAPELWLQAIAATIERSRMLHANSTAIRERSAWLVEQSSALRQKSITERERAVRQRQTAEKVILEFRKWPGSSDEKT